MEFPEEEMLDRPPWQPMDGLEPRLGEFLLRPRLFQVLSHKLEITLWAQLVDLQDLQQQPHQVLALREQQVPLDATDLPLGLLPLRLGGALTGQDGPNLHGGLVIVTFVTGGPLLEAEGKTRARGPGARVPELVTKWRTATESGEVSPGAELE